MVNELLLQLGEDIPFAEAQIELHQPTMEEVGMVGEGTIYNACFFIDFDKDLLSEEDRKGLENKSNFEIFMSIMCTKNDIKMRNQVLILFTLLFPEYKIEINTDKILLQHNKDDRLSCIDDKNYDIFKDIIVKMFCLKEIKSSSQAYNPADERARKIAEKFNKKNKKIGKEEKGLDSIFGHYISILSVGLQKDKNSFSNYTIYQLLDEYNRFQAKISYDAYVQAKIAGAENLEDVDHWMIDNIHS